MSSPVFELELQETSLPPVFRSLTVSELAQLNEPLPILEEPAPHTKLGQQVHRLEELGYSKAAKAVKSCGRRGEKTTYQCGRITRTIIRSHRRFCCVYCDRKIATRLFDEHRHYRARLHHGATIYRVTVRCGISQLSAPLIRDLEDSFVEAIRQWLKGYSGWGFKALTHYDQGDLTIEAIIALPPGRSLPSVGLLVPGATCRIGRGNFASAFEEMLSDMLRPRLTAGHGVLRADLMAAFQGGNHLRSSGIFYGLVSEKRRERKNENLHLIDTQGSSGAGSEVAPKAALQPGQYCPRCGPRCRRTAVRFEILSNLDPISRSLYTAVPAIEEKLREMWRKRYDFGLAERIN
jgi:hypothetical protein